ncbi:UDP-N-acetylmuramoyl-L-alanyl-D-glutamate--2,6-diaminopimelate ligase [Nocardioides sp. CBS4Y-1]|uniref:UDP-N-acetylmuramoyl-L-alanyl-D-glutamate--2,6-diaminopimelate ligase n=1 Tax=Nocardioides acrostichi TaxID=2784339 RepID=A0A930UYZ9_9ACTN|nr:UDP-N-acetylmuramoyl-L-alanyl-D-glutamate--2,6-diaminopimelate ligase [Nocardioides acrostichi]
MTPLGRFAGWLLERDRTAQAVGFEPSDDAGPRVTGVTLSTRRVRPGDLYAALPGARAHGADFADQALASGAVAVFTDPAGAARLPSGVPALVVEGPRRLLGALSAEVYGHPATRLTTIGVTGTQGKTTTTRLLEGGLAAAGIASAVVGTVGTRIAGVDVETALTTPEAPDLQALFAVMVEQGVQACAMEVSSHALVLGRVDGVVFDLACFLNLGRDHLDFHETVEEYYAAKASLFTSRRARRALVNLDDEHGRRLARETDLPLTTFSLAGALADHDADWWVEQVRPAPSRTDFTLHGPDALTAEAGVPLAGSFNVSNALAAAASAGEAGLDAAAVAAGIATMPGVPGRLESVHEGQDFEVVVDYAHKPDAVEAAIGALRPLTEGRLIVVLGAGGDRDKGKRPVMGEIAGRLADVLVVTDDNPRTEDPAGIRAAVLAGARGVDDSQRADVREVGDRRQAIALALALAATGDIVLIAGKGHETGQQVGEVVHPFDDREVARVELRRRASRSDG